MLHLKFKLRFTLTVLFLLALLLFFAYPLYAQSAEHKVRVAARICPPFVMNDTVLKYKIKEAQAEGRYETLYVLPFVFEKQNYGFALPDESPHLEMLNQALLSVRDTPEWKVEIAKYIGKR